MRADEGDGFGGHPKVSGGGSRELGRVRMAWCRAWTPKGRLAFVVTGRFVGFSNIWSHFECSALFLPQLVACCKILSHTPQRNPFLIQVTSPWPLYFHIQQIKTYQFCFSFSQRTAERAIQITLFALMSCWQDTFI